MKVSTPAKRIREALEIRDMKQTDLVERTGISKATISQYVNGKYEPKQINIGLLATALDVSPAWLMGYDVGMNQNDDPDFENMEVSEILEYIHKTPELKILLDSSSKLTKQQLLSLIELVKNM